MPNRHYSDFLTRVGGNIGLSYTGMTSDELSWLNSYFNSNNYTIWTSNTWSDVCPYGEARFAGNTLHYTNDISQTTYWTTTAATVTPNSLANPADGRTTACTLNETSANSTPRHQPDGHLHSGGDLQHLHLCSAHRGQIPLCGG